MSSVFTAIVPEDTLRRIEMLVLEMQIEAAASAKAIKPLDRHDGRSQKFVYVATPAEMAKGQQIAKKSGTAAANKYLADLRSAAEEAHRIKKMEEDYTALQARISPVDKQEKVNRVRIVAMLLKEALDARDEKKAADV